jgi:glyoxylase-like metal-dependent hydrolase (beta-lactamase superfamily II)
VEVKTESGRIKSDLAKSLASDYGIHRIRISTPIPDLKVNIYFAQEPVPTLIDAPPGGALCLDELNAALLARGHSVEEIRRIIVSHPHFDHFGGTQRIMEMSGAEVWVYEGASHRFENFKEEDREEKAICAMLLKEAGGTTAEVENVVEFFEARSDLAQNIFPSRCLKVGDRFEFGSLTLAVAAVPGHTPWCILLFDENEQIAFGGDLFLNGNPSDPLIIMAKRGSTEYKSLTSYKLSLEAVERMNLKILLPGHGGIIQDPSKRIEDRLKAIDKRRLAVLRTLKKRNQTAIQITRQVFPNLPQAHLFIGIVEVLSHLELLEEDVFVERRDDIPWYCAKG